MNRQASRRPDGWITVRIGDALQHVVDPLRVDDSRYYNLISIKRRHCGMVHRERLPGSAILTKNLQHVIPGTFVIARRQIVHGACAIAAPEFGDSVMSMSYSCFRGTQICDVRYFFALAQQPHMVQYFWDASHGVVVEKLNFQQEQWLRYDVHLPPLEEQQRIVEILDTLDDVIRATEGIIAKLEVAGSALLRDLTEHARLKGSTTPLDDAGTWLSGGTPNTDEVSFWGGQIPWITASSLRTKYLSNSARKLTPAGAANGSRLVPKGTVLCVVRGMSLKTEFRVGIADVELAFGQDCKAFLPGPGWLPEYLYLQLRSREPEVLKLVDETSHGTGRLQMSLLGSLEVDLIPATEQRRLVAIYAAHERRVALERHTLDKLRAIRSGLAADLLSGAVRTACG